MRPSIGGPHLRFAVQPRRVEIHQDRRCRRCCRPHHDCVPCLRHYSVQELPEIVIGRRLGPDSHHSRCCRFHLQGGGQHCEGAGSEEFQG
ncbi:hypothetical protein CLOM_g4679 [Closterium sp. NIES-68]|nr:hypothetical protein CLOM_g4679 [Closterium sp. NIES-68]GJP57713.1 hypothetical protein CLOP_g17127 [Closterium sp. NIES-67]